MQCRTKLWWNLCQENCIYKKQVAEKHAAMLSLTTIFSVNEDCSPFFDALGTYLYEEDKE